MAEKLDFLEETLKLTGFPVAYGYFPTVQALPYICFREAYSNNFAADGAVYLPVDHMQVELYTKTKDPASEDKVETALSSFVWEKTETYLESERCFQILYELEM